MTSKEKKICLIVYNCLLKHQACLQGRGYRKVSTFEKVTKSVYFKLIYSLTHKCLKDGYTTYKEIDEFFYKGRIYSKEDFEPSSLVSNFDLIKELKYEEDTIESIYKYIYNDVENITNLLEENELDYEDLLKGKPPLIMNMWKHGSISVYTMLSILDYNKVKKQAWFKLSCGNKKSDIQLGYTTLKTNPQIIEICKEILTKSIEKLK